MNANNLKLVQLGICFMDESATGNPHAWQFNFADFDPNVDYFSEESIVFFDKYDIDLEKLKAEGVKMADFVPLFRQSGLLGYLRRRWIAFQGEYDFAYLLKGLSESPIPSVRSGFYILLHKFFLVVYDLKLLSEVVLRCPDWMGLRTVARSYDVEREGPQHNAGSDNHLTVKVYLATRNTNCGGKSPPAKWRGLLQGIENPHAEEHRHLNIHIVIP